MAKKQIFSDFPTDVAGVEEWRAWANKVKDWAFSLSKREKRRREQLTNLRKELKRKDKALLRYKTEIGELLDRIKKYENRLLVQLGDLIERLAAKCLRGR